jgi:hypothetical protein
MHYFMAHRLLKFGIAQVAAQVDTVPVRIVNANSVFGLTPP